MPLTRAGCIRAHSGLIISRSIRKELGEESDDGSEAKNLREKIEQAKLPAEAEKEAKRELARMEKLSPTSPEFSVIRTYLEWMAGLPWNKLSASAIDIVKAGTTLDEDHYDLDKVKNRNLEYLYGRGGGRPQLSPACEIAQGHAETLFVFRQLLVEYYDSDRFVRFARCKAQHTRRSLVVESALRS